MILEESKKDVDFWNLWENDKQVFFGKCLKLMNGDVCEAEDALSAAMLKAWEKMIQYRENIRNFKGWALRLMENVCLDHLKKHRRLISYGEIPESLAPKEFDQGHLFLESTEEYDSLEALLEGIFEYEYRLPRRLRDPALLRFLFSVSYREMACRLHITEENARKRVQEVRSVLKVKYGGKINDVVSTFPGEAESLVMKMIREDAWSVLDDCGAEVELSCVSAWLVDALTNAGRAGEILVFLPLKPGWWYKECESFLKDLSRHPGGWKRHLELAHILCAAGIWDQSEKQFRHVLKKHPRSFSAWISLGNMLMEIRTDE